MTNVPTEVISTLSERPFRQQAPDLKTLTYSGGALLFASAIGNGLNYVFGIFLARSLGGEDFGLYALALTIFNILMLSVVFGMDNGAIKFISHYLAEGQRAKAGATLLATAIIAFAAGIIAAIGLALSADTLSTAVYDKPTLSTSLLFFAAALPFATVAIVLLSASQAFQTVRYTILIKYLWEPIAKFVFAGMFLWAGYQLYGVLIAIILTFATSAVLTIRAVSWLAFREATISPGWNKQDVKTLLAYCLPLAISNLFGVVAPRSDILILGYWADAREVGIYLAAFQTAAIMALVLGAFNTALAPIISRAWSQQDKPRLKSSYQAVSRLSATVSFPIFCTLILFTDEILFLFGSTFATGAAVLTILAIGQVFNSATGAANTILLMSGHSRIVMTNTIVMGVVLLLATATIIPLWGMTGAAIAASATFILTNVVRVLQVWRLHQVQPYTWSLMKPLVAGGVATTIIVAMQQTNIEISSFVLAFALGLLYLGGLLALGINQEDRFVFQSLTEKVRSFARVE